MEVRSQQYEMSVKETQWPIVYSSEYNISLCGIEKLHTFDVAKASHIIELLKGVGMIRDDTIVEPMEASEEELLLVHTKKYLSNLKWSLNVVGLMDLPPMALLPQFIVQKKILRPLRFQTGGSILAARLALERGWAVNIGGGFNHCCRDIGGGFCAYADISLAVKFAFENVDKLCQVMIIDLDAHQGNGHERDFMGDKRVSIFDMYNRDIYPQDGFAKRAISWRIEISSFTEDETYLRLLRKHIDGALTECIPDLVIYNAGTDVLAGDPSGKLSLSAQGVVERDQVVFQRCRTRNIPVCMLTSGGYLKQAAGVVADSLLNLKQVGLISCDAAENAPVINKEEPSLPRIRSDGGLLSRLKRSYLTRFSSSTQNISYLVSPSDDSEANDVISFTSRNDADEALPESSSLLY